MFQYATIKALARDCIPILDTKLLRNDTKRQFSLGPYRINAKILDSTLLKRSGRIRRILARLGFRTGDLVRYPFEALVYREDDSNGCFDPNVLQQRGPIVLHGYFQSERYFQNIADTLREELSQINGSSAIFRSIGEEIKRQETNSVSIHIRRGDYESEPKTNAFHGLLEGEYYREAILRIQKQVANSRYYIFSDDPRVACQLLPSNLDYTMVSGRNIRDIEELMLMSFCKHHIIANSSFSWWGAWLGSRGGTTVAPRRWFAQQSQSSIRDRFPSKWEVIG